MSGVGWIMTIILGGLAGFAAEKIMKADMGVLGNIGVGILGAVVLNFILSLLGIYAGGGWIMQGIVAIAGACLLIWAYRAFMARRQ